ncbi:MAG TPA: hypothetical protein VJP78_12955, partial [Thermoleophilia bacterium]|nr:hypothetical protein [Thermoleophilia bacterium]
MKTAGSGAGTLARGIGFLSTTTGLFVVAAGAALLYFLLTAKGRLDDLGTKAAALGRSLVDLGPSARLTVAALRDLAEAAGEEVGGAFTQLVKDAGAVGESVADATAAVRVEAGQQMAGLAQDMQRVNPFTPVTEEFSDINAAIQEFGPSGRDVLRMLRDEAGYTTEELNEYLGSLKLVAGTTTDPALRKSAEQLIIYLNTQSAAVQSERDLVAASQATVDQFTDEGVAVEKLARKYGVPIGIIKTHLSEYGLTAVEALGQGDDAWANSAGIVVGGVNVMSAKIDAFNGIVRNHRDVIDDYLSATNQSFREWVSEGRAAAAEGGQVWENFVNAIVLDLRRMRQEVKAQFDGVQTVLDQFANDNKVSSNELLKAFEEQLNVLTDYDKNYRKVKDRLKGSNKDLLHSILEMGLGGAGLLETLATAGPKAFQKLIDAQVELDDLSHDVGNTVADELVPALEDLVRVFRNLPQRIAMSLGLDLDQAKAAADRFMDFLGGRGLELTTSNNTPSETRPLQHKGGPAGRPSGYASGPPKSDEVDTRLQSGEFVWSRPAVKAVGGLQAMGEWHERARKARRRLFHSGGVVGHTHEDFAGDVESVTSRVQLIRQMFANAKVMGTIAKPEFAVPFSAYGGPGAGTGTPAMAGLHSWIKANFTVSGAPFVAGPGRTINFQPGAALSQHAFGNASDYFAKFAELTR